MTSKIKCVDLEALLADYMDGGLSPEHGAQVEFHLAECPACAELFADAAAGSELLKQAREVEIRVPPVLVRQILEATTQRPHPGWLSIVLGVRLADLWQPRFAMGLAMAALSMVMITHFWGAAENTAYRAWDRTMKQYDNMALVDNVQSQIDDLKAQLERR